MMINGAGIETLLSLYSLHDSGVFEEDFYAFVIIEAIICLPTILGNILILVSIHRFTVLKNKTNILVANLAVADLLVGAVLIPVDLTSMLHKDFASKKWFCLLETSLYVAFLATSVVNLFCISLERWLAIAFPFWYKTHIRAKFLYGVVVNVWFVMSVVAILPLLGYNSYESASMPCNTDLIWVFEYKILITSITVTCLILSSSLYIGVICSAAKQSRRTKTTSQYQTCGRLRKHVKRTRLMMYVLGFFILCWSPFTVLTILCSFYQSHALARARTLSVLLGLLNSGMNWVVYGLLNRKFRRAFKSIVLCSNKRHFRRVPRLSTHV